MSVPSTMRAYRLVAWERPPEVVEVPVPEPGPGELLVQVAGNGLCHSDITMRAMPAAIGEAIGWAMPFTLGHEVGGRVAALGGGINDLTEGEAVALVSPSLVWPVLVVHAWPRRHLPPRSRRPGLRR